MRSEERDRLRQRFGYRCGYCGVSESEVGSELTVDHYHPRSLDAADEPDNWVYCCFACNTYKSDTWAPDSERRILHPLKDDLAQHTREGEDGRLVGITETGRFHIAQLQLNRPPLVASRLARREHLRLTQQLAKALRRQEELRRRVEALEQTVAAAERRLRSLG